MKLWPVTLKLNLNKMTSFKHPSTEKTTVNCILRVNTEIEYTFLITSNAYSPNTLKTRLKLSFISFKGYPKHVVQVENLSDQFHPPDMLLSQYLERI